MSEPISVTGAFSNVTPTTEQPPALHILPPSRNWTPENFARQQIRGLVRQVFFSNAVRPIRQVVFSPTEPGTEVGNLCQWVGRALAAEIAGSVAVVRRHPLTLNEAELQRGAATDQSGYRPSSNLQDAGSGTLRATAVPLLSNLWMVPTVAVEGEWIPDSRWHAHLCAVRREFDYSIVEGPSAAEPNEAIAMAQLADGIILVLSARYTRRASARTIKERLVAAQARILGTVLTDRAFPIPESLYKRL